MEICNSYKKKNKKCRPVFDNNGFLCYNLPHNVDIIQTFSDKNDIPENPDRVLLQG